MEEKIKMMSAASKAIEFKKQNPLAIPEEAFQNVSNYISKIKDIDEKTKICMMAAASEAFNILKQNPKLTEKEALGIVVKKIPNILSNINQE